MEEEMTMIRCQQDENRRLRRENKLLLRLLIVCMVCWLVSEATLIYIAKGG